MIAKGHKTNLETLKRAFADNAAALVECIDKATGKPVVVLCAIGQQGDEYVISPFARMFDGNPYDELNPPK